MTLVISVLSQDCVWQVADRRLTDLARGTVVSRDTNKAVLFAGCMLFAFTGPARLERRDTAAWIADQLSSDRDPEKALSSLPLAINAALRRLPGPRELRALALDGVGWALDRQTGAVGPRLLRVSNCIDPDGVWTGRLDDPVTVFDGMMKRGVLVNMRAAGQPVPLIGRFWERVVRRRIASGAPPSEVGACLVQFVRDVAARNKAVGSGVLLSALPRAAVLEPTGMTIAGMPTTESATFKYFAEDSAEGIEKGPEVAGLGGSRVTGFRSRTDPDGTQMVEASFRLPAHPPQ